MVYIVSQYEKKSIYIVSINVSSPLSKCFSIKTSGTSTVGKVSKHSLFSAPYFPALRLNTEIYGVITPYTVRIQENTDQKELSFQTLFPQWRTKWSYFKS